MGKTSRLKTKKVTAAFALVALVAGFFFLDNGVTGNVVLNNEYPVDVVSLIGLLLVLCSGILAAYTLKK